jgi:hypothetical protein
MLADVLRLSLTDNPTVERFSAEYPETAFSVTPAADVSAPSLVATVTGTDIGVSRQALNKIVDDASLRLNILQSNAGSGDDQKVTLVEVSRETKPSKPILTAPIRNGSVAAVAGFSLLSLLLAALDNRQARENDKRKKTTLPGGGPREGGNPPGSNPPSSAGVQLPSSQGGAKSAPASAGVNARADIPNSDWLTTS